MSRKPTFKPLSFTNTLRNPERIKPFLKVFNEFNGQVLTNDLIIEICRELLKRHLYTTMGESDDIKAKRISGEFLNDVEANHILNTSIPQHKEAGFDRGWPSRFDTWYEFPQKLGFVNYSIGNTIEFSPTGLMLIDEDNKHLEQVIFSNALIKYQTKNPFTKVLNDTKPVILLLKTIKLVNELSRRDSGLSIREIPIFICWRDNDHQALAERIIQLRKDHGFNPSDEVILDICSNFLDETKRAPNTLLGYAKDEVIRKMRLTGLFSIRGGGRFISINQQQNDYVDYIFENYSDIINFSSKDEFYNFISVFDIDLAKLHSLYKEPAKSSEDDQLKWIDNLGGWENIQKEILNCTSNRPRDVDPSLKYIGKSLRFEWLIGLAIKCKFPNITVEQSCSIDDQGLPEGFASGVADIKCIFNNKIILLEPTTSNGTQQHFMESAAIQRHLMDEIEKNDPNFDISTFLVAPLIAYDSQVHADHVKTYGSKRRKKIYKSLNVNCIDVESFINKLDSINEEICWKN